MNCLRSSVDKGISHEILLRAKGTAYSGNSSAKCLSCNIKILFYFLVNILTVNSDNKDSILVPTASACI